MSSHTLRILAALAVLVLGAPVNAQSVHVTRAQILELPTNGFSAPPYALDPGVIAGDWKEVALPYAPRPEILTPAAGTYQDPAPTVISWYRMRVDGLERTRAPRYLYIPRWKSDGTIAVYADSRLVYQSHANLLWNGSNIPLWIALDETDAAVTATEIFVRIQHLRGTGGALSSIRVGTFDDLVWRQRTREWLQAQLPLKSSAAFLAVGVFALFVWFQRRHERLYLLLFAIAVLSYIHTIHNYIGVQRLLISDEWFGWLTVNSLFWLVASTHLFLVRVHERSMPWLTDVVLGVAATSSILTLPLSAAFPKATLIAPALYIALLVVAGAAFSCDIRNCWQRRSYEGLLLAVWSLVSILLGVYDWLLQVNLVNIEGAYIGSYSNIGAFFIFMYIMYRRYLGAIRHVEQVNASLAERLEVRESELSTSYARLHEVERSQMLSQERQRLMQDMHDGLGSSLLSALRVVEGGRMNEADVAEVLKGCIDDLRLAIDSMEPVESDLVLLLATLRYRLQSRLERSGIQLRWEIAEVPPLHWLDPRNNLHILRILQEAFTNIIKHTRATEIRVGTAVDAGRLLVTITDNGQGFDVAAALESSSGKGLANQKRRARAIGADVVWNSAASGTSLVLSLPIERESARGLNPLRLQPHLMSTLNATSN